MALSTPNTFHRLNRKPLDDSEVFSNLRDLMDYCNNGARYNGQRVVVDDGSKSMEYLIKNNIPMIDTKGNDLIFKKITFSGDAAESHGLLIYYNNCLSGGTPWSRDNIISFDEDKLSLFNQIEIFRILDAAKNKTFKFYMETLQRNSTNPSTYIWNQSYNPFYDTTGHAFGTGAGNQINQMIYNPSGNYLIQTPNSSRYIMPASASAINAEADKITKIYIKAEDYYNAYK